MSANTIFPLKNIRKVYCAGPLFNEPERMEMRRIADVLQKAGFDTFLPHQDGMEFALIQPVLLKRGYDAKQAGHFLHAAIFALDVYQTILGCGSLVFNMNGRVPDEGAVAEATMAWTLGKPVVMFKEDARCLIQGRDNPLIVGQVDFQTVSDLAQIPQVLEETISNHPLDSTWKATCPPYLLKSLEAGEQLWQQIKVLGHTRPAETVADLVVEQFGEQVDKQMVK